MHLYSYVPFIGSWAMRSEYVSLEAERIQNNIALGLGYEILPEPDSQKPFSVLVSGANVGVRSGGASASPTSVNVIMIAGPMMKSDQPCGGDGIRTICQRIANAAADSNSLGTVLIFDTPGGQTSTVEMLRASIAEHKATKPIVAHVEQMCSAGLMTGVECNEVIMASDFSEIGSLGVMAILRDDRAALEAQGIKMHIIYSTLSEDKNKPVEEALDGDYIRLQTEILDPFAQDAINHLKAQRPKVTDARVFKGGVFYAKDAVKIGLADSIGSLQFAVNRVAKLAKAMAKNATTATTNKTGSSTLKPISLTNMKVLSKTTIPFLLVALGIAQLTAGEDGNFTLPDGASDRLAEAYQQFGKTLPMRGLAISETGSFTASLEQLLVLNSLFGTAAQEAQAAQIASQAQQVADTNIIVTQLSQTPESIPPPVTPPAGGFVMPTSGYNAVTDDKPWNKLAWLQFQRSKGLASRQEFMAYEMSINSALTVDQMNTELGSYHREQNTSIIEVIWPTESADSLFPANSTGQLDELPQTALFLGEFLQARNAAWAEKGGFEFQADKSKVREYQMSHRFAEAELLAMMKTWLGELAGKDHPFHETFVSYLTRMIAIKVKAEIQQNLFSGYYQTPTSGTAGPAKHSIHGLYAVLLKRYAEFRLLPFFTGKPEYKHFDANGDPNPNHLWYKVKFMIDQMPKELRDTSSWNVYISKDDAREYRLFEQVVLKDTPNFSAVEGAYKRDNFTIQQVPNWTDGAIVIAQPGMIRQGFREKGSENTIYIQREKRDTIVFLDGAHVIEPVFTGYQFASLAELEASKGSKQFIFTNLEFGPLSPATLAVGATTADASKHFAFVTSANTAGTTFTSFANATEGQTLYLVGGSNTNPTTIASNNAAFTGLLANLVLKSGVTAQFLVVGGKFVLVGLSEVSGQGIQTFTVDDVTPSVAGGLAFSVSATNAADKVNITSLLGGSVNAEYVIYGATGTNQCVLKNGGNLVIGADITMTTGTVVKLKYTNMNKFVKIS